MNCKSRLLIKITFIASSMFLGIIHEKAFTQELNTIIKNICLYEFKQEFQKAQKNIPQGTAEFTCNCFVKNINKGNKLNNSKIICKDAALKKYNL